MPAQLYFRDSLGNQIRLVRAVFCRKSICRNRMNSNRLREAEIGYFYLSRVIFTIIAIDHKNG